MNNVKMNLSIMGNNVNGITSKLDSLENNVREFQPTFITLQETKVRKKGLIKLANYQIYEHIRESELQLSCNFI